MEKSSHLGMNRTGIDMSPIDGKAMVKGMEKYNTEPGKGDGIRNIRRAYTGPDETVGSVPMPGTVVGAMESIKNRISEQNVEVLINKLGERLAFERTGVRLYEALIRKCESAQDDPLASLVSVSLLRQFCNEEAEHFTMVKSTMEALGADPTSQTPDADVAGLASLGIGKVLSESRTSIGQCLEAMLTVELTDNASWQLLHDLCEGMGFTDIANEFNRAIDQENIHLEQVKEWLRAMVLEQAGANH